MPDRNNNNNNNNNNNDTYNNGSNSNNNRNYRVTLHEGLPHGHNNNSSTRFDRLWSKGEKNRRFYICICKKPEEETEEGEMDDDEKKTRNVEE